MDRHTDSRSLAAARSPGDPQPALPAAPVPDPADHRTTAPSPEEATIALLADILLGERDWTLAEVRALIALREATGRDGGSAPGT